MDKYLIWYDLIWYAYHVDRSVDYNTIDVSNIVDIYKYLMKKHHNVKKNNVQIN